MNHAIETPILAALLSAAALFLSPRADCDARFVGVWEYRQAAGAGFDAEGERIELSCRGGALRGLYFGLEREGEHGLFYTAVEMTNLRVTPDGVLSFTVPERELFSERPTSLEDVRQKKVTWAGLTRDELSMRGRLEAGRLVVTCTSTSHSCPEDVMVFRKGRWN